MRVRGSLISVMMDSGVFVFWLYGFWVCSLCFTSL